MYLESGSSFARLGFRALVTRDFVQDSTTAHNVGNSEGAGRVEMKHAGYIRSSLAESLSMFEGGP